MHRKVNREEHAAVPAEFRRWVWPKLPLAVFSVGNPDDTVFVRGAEDNPQGFGTVPFAEQARLPGDDYRLNRVKLMLL